jgi:YD repeat-containing protein
VYDEFGNPVHEKKFIEGKLTETISYSYNDNGKVTRRVTANSIQTFEVIDEFTYDQFGNMLQHVTFQNGFLVFENRCTYDTFHNLMTEEFFEINYWEKRITRHEKLIHSISA